MIYNYTTSKEVIAKVFRDFGVQRSDFINDAVEWIGEALELIGTAKQTVPKLRIVKASDFKISKPRDLYILDTVRYSETTSTTRPGIDDFKYIATEGDIDKNPGLFGEQDSIYRRSTEQYFHQGSFIKFTFEDNWVALEYHAIPIDEDGYPLLPDAAEYKEALTWYIISKLLLRGKKHPSIDFQYADQKWERNATRARNAMNIPDKGQYRAFKEKWVQLIPEYDRTFEQLEEAVDAENVTSRSFQNKLIG